MPFYNIKYILKLCLKFVSALSFLLLITLCFFLILSNSNSVSAEVVANDLPSEIFDLAETYTNYFDNPNYDLLICRHTDTLSAHYYILYIDKTTNTKFYVDTSQQGVTWFRSNSQFGGFIADYTYYNNTFNYQSANSFNNGYWTNNSNSLLCDNYYLWSDFDIYDNSSLTTLFVSAKTFPTSFVAPTLFPSDTSVLSSGQFTFFIVDPRYSS